MIDIWRKENPHRNIFTYHDNNQSIHSRIDRFYINKTQKIQNISITPNNLSDDEALILTLLIKNQVKYIHSKTKTFQQKFRSFWKDWRTRKTYYKSLNQWWESGKILFKT